eukprot:SAG22_NODE_2655_length_2333_cov_5.679499_3_plen_100_part_01
MGKGADVEGGGGGGGGKPEMIPQEDERATMLSPAGDTRAASDSVYNYESPVSFSRGGGQVSHVNSFDADVRVSGGRAGGRAGGGGGGRGREGGRGGGGGG